MEKKKIVSQIILIFYSVEVLLLKFQGESILLNNLVLLFPIGVLLPKIWREFQKINIMFYTGTILSIFLELFTILGEHEIHFIYAVIEGIIGTILGYFGYYVCEKS